MTRLLLDEQVSPALARPLADLGHDAVALSTWEGGILLGAPDAEVLALAATEGRIFVTHDRTTIPGLLRTWAAEGRTHAGVIFLGARDVRLRNVGVTSRRLAAIFSRLGDVDWTDRVVYLPPDR